MYPTIVEPFAGAAGYSLRHHRHKVILVDKDPIIAATWRYLISVTPAEILALPDIEPGQDVNDIDVHQEARWLIGWWLSKGAAAPRRSMSAWLVQPRYRCQSWGDAVRERIARQVPLIRNWEIIEGSYHDAPDIVATWFVDPPYAIAGKHYRHGSRGIDYADLAEWCRSRSGQTMVCENVGADWLPFCPHIGIKANESASGGKVSREAIWLS